MRRIEMTINFTDEDGKTRSETQSFETTYTPDQAGEHRVTHILMAELKVMLAEQAPPKHNAVARCWHRFPNRSVSLDENFNINSLFDIQNSQALWFELSSLVMGVEGDLILARAYKALEPSQEPSDDDSAAINDLYYIHGRKMTLLNQTVQGLIKVQELVNRLLHESLEGGLVDSSKSDWQETQLTRKNVENGLEARRVAGGISQSDFDAIREALAIPKNTPKGKIARAYRNRLMHHLRPSVDYPMFFSALQSRAGEEVKDAQGNVIGRTHKLFVTPLVEYRFDDLAVAFSEYLDAIVAMLQKLREVAILSQ